MKKKYCEAEVDIIRFESTDVITTSTGIGADGGLDEDGWA